MKQLATSPGKTQPLYRLQRRNANAEQESEHAEAVLPPFHRPARRRRDPGHPVGPERSAPRQRDSGSTFVREQVVDCGTKSPKEICVISYDSETPR